ncbi:unnamed protein product [Gadus morhua 'NCC']
MPRIVVDPHLLYCGGPPSALLWWTPTCSTVVDPHLLYCGGPPPALVWWTPTCSSTLDPHLLQYLLLQEKSPGLTLCPAGARLRVRPSFRTIEAGVCYQATGKQNPALCEMSWLE